MARMAKEFTFEDLPPIENCPEPTRGTYMSF